MYEHPYAGKSHINALCVALDLNHWAGILHLLLCRSIKNRGMVGGQSSTFQAMQSSTVQATHGGDVEETH